MSSTNAGAAPTIASGQLTNPDTVTAGYSTSTLVTELNGTGTHLQVEFTIAAAGSTSNEAVLVGFYEADFASGVSGLIPDSPLMISFTETSILVYTVASSTPTVVTSWSFAALAASTYNASVTLDPTTGTVYIAGPDGGLYTYQDSAFQVAAGYAGVTIYYGDAATDTRITVGQFGASTYPLDTQSHFNWRAENTRNFQIGLGDAIAGTGYCDVLVLGDSMSSPWDGSAFNFPSSYWRKLKDNLVAIGVPNGGTGIVSSADANFGLDPRITTTGTWTNGASDPLSVPPGGPTGNVYQSSSTAGDTMTFTSDVAGTCVDVHYANASGQFTVSIDGGSPVTVTPTGALTYGTYTVTGLSNATHTVMLTNLTSTFIAIGGFDVYQTSGLRFHNLGVQWGIGALEWLAATNYGGLQSVSVGYMPKPNLVILALGANDIKSGSTVAQVASYLMTIHNSFLSSDMLLILEPAGLPNPNSPFGPAPVSVFGIWQSFQITARQLALALDVPLIDLVNRWGSSTQMAAANLVGVDFVHPNEAAAVDLGTYLTQVIANNIGVLPGLI